MRDGSQQHFGSIRTARAVRWLSRCSGGNSPGKIGDAQFNADMSALLRINIDLQFTLLASDLYRPLANRLGNEQQTARAGTVFRNPINVTATIAGMPSVPTGNGIVQGGALAERMSCSWSVPGISCPACWKLDQADEPDRRQIGLK